jgi:hypothetical protein
MLLTYRFRRRRREWTNRRSGWFSLNYERQAKFQSLSLIAPFLPHFRPDIFRLWGLVTIC